MFPNSDQSKINFKNDFESNSVCDGSNHELDTNPDENYSISATAITDSMNAHLEKNSKVQQKKTQKKIPGLHKLWCIASFD